MCLIVSKDTYQFRSLMSATIDAKRYFPMVAYRSTEGQLQHMWAWVDQWNYISNTGSDANIGQEKSYLESNELVLSIIDNGLAYAPAANMYILRSNYTNPTDDIKHARFSSLVWPDPIDINTFIHAAKNYVAYPALAALGGLVLGGPQEAVIAGGTQLAKAAIDDITSVYGLII